MEDNTKEEIFLETKHSTYTKSSSISKRGTSKKEDKDAQILLDILKQQKENIE